MTRLTTNQFSPEITMIERLNQLYQNRLIIPENVNQIPQTGYMVYILVFNDNPIVVGHGKKNRAKVIFDCDGQITSSHLKALFVRLYNLFGNNGHFERYIITCESKDEAQIIEKKIHKEIGGNNRNLPDEILNHLFDGIDSNSITYLVLEIALRSSFDGLSDIRKWRADGILSDVVWSEISQKLQLK